MRVYNRIVLADRKVLPLVSEYFRFTGWTILPPDVKAGEVFRANRLDHKRPIVVYEKNYAGILFINKRDHKIFEKFLVWKNARLEMEAK